MSTVKTFSGMDDDAKPSSRVLRPPGGTSSCIFGDPVPLPTKQPAKPYQKTSLFGSEHEVPQSNSRAARHTGAAAAPFASDATSYDKPAEKAAPRKPSSNPIAHTEPEAAAAAAPAPAAEAPAPAPEAAAPAPAPAPATRANPLLGESAAQPAAPAKNIHTSTKVRQPPGGASSGPLW